MSWSQTSQDLIASLIADVSSRPLSQLEADYLTNLQASQAVFLALVEDPPGFGTDQLSEVPFWARWGMASLGWWTGQRANCLYWMNSYTVGRAITLLPVCTEYFDELAGTLRSIAQTGREFIAAPLMLCEAIESQADAVDNAIESASNIAGTDQEGCPILVEFPLGFGDSCAPKFPAWLGIGIAAWVGLKVWG